MTTGSITIGASYSPYYYYRNWSGSDGKFETVNGVRREKWNGYSTTVQRQRSFPSISNQYIDSNGYPATAFLNAWTAKDDVSLQNKLVQKLKGHSFNLAIFAGEGHKTVDMVVQNLGAIGRSFSSVRKGNFLQALSALGVGQSRRRSFKSKDIGGRWLELQYGWLPLVSDVFEAAKAFEALTSGPRTSLVRVNSRKVGTYDASQSKTLWSTIGPWRISKSIVYEMTESLSTPRSLGLYDPLALAWELLPYSFVVDWFIPIGSYLENLNVIPFLNGRTLTSTLKTYQAGSQIIYNPKGGWWGTGARNEVRHMELVRVVTTGLQLAQPGFKRLPDAMSPKHIWNAIALASQRFLK